MKKERSTKEVEWLLLFIFSNYNHGFLYILLLHCYDFWNSATFHPHDRYVLTPTFWKL